jgi:hypothetical protein
MWFLTAMLYIALAFPSVAQQYTPFEWNKKSTLSTERRVEFPGIVLDPGIYIVRLGESGEGRSVVQILTSDETQVLASVPAVPDHRTRPDANTEFTFHEIRTDGPHPVQSWFFPGDLVGLEFLYSKARAKEIAKSSGSHVMASNGSKDGPIIAITPNGKEIVLAGEPAQTARQKPQ